MLFDLDALAAEYQPVEVKFRGVIYTLGESVSNVLAAVELARQVPDNAKGPEQLALLPQVLAALSPAIGAVIAATPLGVAEQLLFQRAVTEALGRISKVPFRPVGEGAGAPSADSTVPELLPAVQAV